MAKPVIAIVGRPNVGKSALFNRIVGRRIAIVHDQPGVTRDRISVEAEWRGIPFTLVDTGGIGLLEGEKSHDVIERATLEQVDLAIESAQVVILVTDVREGVVPLDMDIATRLRQSGKPVVVAVNKVDNVRMEEGVLEFSTLGFDRVIGISALHDRNINALMKQVIELLPEEMVETGEAEEESEQGEEAPLKLAIVGRPNVGKSSLINTLVQSARVVVSPVPGTTRDAIEVPMEIETEGRRERYILIDTAGVRKRRRLKDPIDFYSVVRTEEAIRRADIVVLMLDADHGITELDKKIGGKIVEAGKGCVLAVNKWDLYAEKVEAVLREEGKSEEEIRRQIGSFADWVRQKLFFLDYAPVVFTSATQNMNLDRLLEAVRFVGAQLQQRVPTALLNRTLHDAVEMRQPAKVKNKRLKLFYATQVETKPPTFVLFVNDPDLFTEPYSRYLVHELRKAFGFEGCPIRLIARPRSQREKVRTQKITGPKR